ncbi:MYND domain protein [Penicillium argentinense]|uniref:MYND domain protein n=1 Tax=Penicillium argentinense TaxID=1131581 RepID=A0A9W9KKS8_9EURO|nr:MYND domain protein [Penicillium argentinense]KAJ5109965.1 MYND domain protein [Penicillium argentinense]
MWSYAWSTNLAVSPKRTLSRRGHRQWRICFPVFLDKVDKEIELFSPWWSRGKLEECVQFGLQPKLEVKQWWYLDNLEEVSNQYEDVAMPLQLMMFDELAYYLQFGDLKIYCGIPQ